MGSPFPRRDSIIPDCLISKKSFIRIYSKYIKELADSQEPRKLENTYRLKNEIFDIDSITGNFVKYYMLSSLIANFIG